MFLLCLFVTDCDMLHPIFLDLLMHLKYNFFEYHPPKNSSISDERARMVRKSEFLAKYINKKPIRKIRNPVEI